MVGRPLQVWRWVALQPCRRSGAAWWTSTGTDPNQFVLHTARQPHNKRATWQLEAIGPPPQPQGESVRHPGPVGGQLRRSHLQPDLRHCGAEPLASLVRSSDCLPGDVIRTVCGISATQAALLAELAELDLVRSLPHLDVPVVMAQGRQDQVAPGEAAQRFADSLEAPTKQLVWFEHSAHTPHLEEPAKFRDLLMRARAASSTGYLTSGRRPPEAPPSAVSHHLRRPKPAPPGNSSKS